MEYCSKCKQARFSKREFGRVERFFCKEKVKKVMDGSSYLSFLDYLEGEKQGSL